MAHLMLRVLNDETLTEHEGGLVDVGVCDGSVHGLDTGAK